MGLLQGGRLIQVTNAAFNLYERKIGTLKTGRLLQGGRLIQGRYIQVPLYIMADHICNFCSIISSPFLISSNSQA